MVSVQGSPELGGRHQPEHRAIARRSALGRGAVQIARCVRRQAIERLAAVRPGLLATVKLCNVVLVHAAPAEAGGASRNTVP